MKCAIVEYENYTGNYPPIVVEIGSWWKLFPKLMKWADQSPSYAKGEFSYIEMTAKIKWEGYAGRESSTVRKIVEIGKDEPFTEHMRVRWF